MKREFLKSLGIEDKDIIDKIMDENSSDIGRAKGELQSVKDELQTTKQDLENARSTITDLEGKVGDTAALQQQIAQLTTDKTNLANELNTKVLEIQKTHAIEGGIRDAKGRNIKAIMALLDMEKITYENGELGGLAEQLTALAGADDSSMLFGDTQPQLPSGTHVSNPNNGGNGSTPSTPKTLAEAVAKVMSK